METEPICKSTLSDDIARNTAAAPLWPALGEMKNVKQISGAIGRQKRCNIPFARNSFALNLLRKPTKKPPGKIKRLVGKQKGNQKEFPECVCQSYKDWQGNRDALNDKKGKCRGTLVAM